MMRVEHKDACLIIRLIKLQPEQMLISQILINLFFLKITGLNLLSWIK